MNEVTTGAHILSLKDLYEHKGRNLTSLLGMTSRLIYLYHAIGADYQGGGELRESR
jgi:hypothetical protein